MKEIPLTQGKVAIVDDEDYEELVQYKWYAHKNRRCWYARRSTRMAAGKQGAVLMHRQVMRAAPRRQVDHRDGDGLHNWRTNLRYCTNGENQSNLHYKKEGCTSRYKGVSWYRRSGKWVAGIRVSGKGVNLGYFEEEEDAARAYNAAAVELFGEFASVNTFDK